MSTEQIIDKITKRSNRPFVSKYYPGVSLSSIHEFVCLSVFDYMSIKSGDNRILSVDKPFKNRKRRGKAKEER